MADPGPGQFERFEKALKQVMSVPKADIEKQIRAKKKQQTRRKPKG